MKNMVKVIFPILLYLGLCIPVYAAGTVNIGNAKAEESKVTVSGTTENVTAAVAVQVLDGETVIAMDSFVVLNDAFSGQIEGLSLTVGKTYTIRIADYDGGTWQTTTSKAVASSSGGTGTPGDGGNGSGSSDDDNGSASNSNDSGSSEFKEEKVNVPVEYIVVKGDTLGKIARRNNMTLSRLLALNPQIKNPNFIRVGQKIVVGYNEKTVTTKVTDKSTENSTVTNTNSVYYTVQGGDSLYKIAKMNKMALNRLISLNPDVMMRKYIYPGQKIRVK